MIGVEQVVWLDHTGPWPLDDPADRPNLRTRETVGFVVREDETVLVLAGTHDDDEGFSDLTVLGKGLVVERTALS